MRIRKIFRDDIKVSNMSNVKVRITGNTQVVQFTAGNNKKCPVVNLTKDTYLNKETGEVMQKKISENRYQTPKSVRKSINKLMDLIRCNATDSAKCKWLTVTYATSMTDGKQAFLDAKLFLRRLKRYLARQKELTVDGVSKQFIKGERLKFYPRGMNLYFSSRGMKKPEVEEMTNEEAMKVVADSKLVYRETYAIGEKGNGNLI